MIDCHAPVTSIAIELAAENVKKCYEELATKVKAIYVTAIVTDIPSDYMTAILDSLAKAEIYTFAQTGVLLKAGAMLSIKKRDDARYAGRFYASNIVAVLNGSKPGNLNQIYPTPSKIIINLRTAKRVGYILSVDILEIVDEFYDG